MQLAHTLMEPAPPDAQPARTHEATRAALAAYRWSVLLRLAVAAVLAVAVVACIATDQRRYTALLDHGTRTLGVVVFAHQTAVSSKPWLLRMRVAYRAADNSHATTVWLNADGRYYRAGAPVPVVYDGGRPEIATVVGERDIVWWHRMFDWFAPMFAVFYLVWALLMARALRRTSRALRRRPWVSSEYTIAIGSRLISGGERAGLGTLMLLSPGTAGDEFSYLNVSAPPRQLSPFRNSPPRLVWVARKADGRPVAVATPGAGHLYMVREFDPNRGWRGWLAKRMQLSVDL
jgi:hypothetical protein